VTEPAICVGNFYNFARQNNESKSKLK